MADRRRDSIGTRPSPTTLVANAQPPRRAGARRERRRAAARRSPAVRRRTHAQPAVEIRSRRPRPAVVPRAEPRPPQPHRRRPRHPGRPGRAGRPDGSPPGTRSSASRRPTARCGWRSWPSMSSARAASAATSPGSPTRPFCRSPNGCTPRCSTRRSAASGRAGGSPACRRRSPLGAFRRLTRLRGPVVRAALANRELRVPAVEALTVRRDRLTDRLGAASTPTPTESPAWDAVAGNRVTPEIADRVAPGVDRRRAGPVRGTTSWPAPGIEEELDPDRLERHRRPRRPRRGRDLGGS